MKLDINELYHNYIVRVVIFSVFLYKRQLRDPNNFKFSILKFVNKRLPWKINLFINTGEKLDKKDEREILLDELLNGVESDYLSTVTVSFTTPLKEMTIEIDLRDEEKYEEYLYL